MIHFAHSPIRIVPSAVTPNRHCNYLGVTLASRLNCQQNIETTTDQASKRMQALRLFGKAVDDRCSIHTLSRKYTACLRPILVYGHPIMLTQNNAKQLSSITYSSVVAIQAPLQSTITILTADDSHRGRRYCYDGLLIVV